MGRRGEADLFAATALALASACPPTLRAPWRARRGAVGPPIWPSWAGGGCRRGRRCRPLCCAPSTCGSPPWARRRDL